MVAPDIIKEFKKQLVINDKQRSAKHKPSGKLSAGKLGFPVQWQVLHCLGVEKDENEPEKLAKFLRGRVCEQAVVDVLENTAMELKTQVFVEYRNTIGYLDVLLNDYPIEVKSVASNKFNRVKTVSYGHALQACLYALALGKKRFGVLYVEPSEFRMKFFEMETENWKHKVDNSIDVFDEAMAQYKETSKIPGFYSREFWHQSSANFYSKYQKFTRPFILDKID